MLIFLSLNRLESKFYWNPITMRLIKKIEINYLRSLYSATLDNIGDLNVVFGRNDSGKSNLLRALNLFFNAGIEAERKLDFALDMSDYRKKEARDAKGRQFIWIKITFLIPSNYRGALGNEITIKRQWNRDGDMNQTVFPSLDSAGKQARLTRLLNDIDFTYIPAIKDLNVYADLIERMYGTAAETVSLQEATSAFVDAIESQTTALSVQLASLFGAPARLAPPTEMSRLFRNLDFAHGEDRHSLLRQKGDGVKARHLPELLRFINEKEPRKKFFLWGFEEPENSLDLGAAESEAGRFSNFATREDTQIFITSHSPAFYLASSDSEAEIRRFFITKQQPGKDSEIVPKNGASRIDLLDDAETRMEEAGLLQLPFVIRHMKEQREALAKVESEAANMRSKLEQLEKPTLFVEGKHDVHLFTAALSRVNGGENIAVKPLGGTPNSHESLLSAILEQGGVNASASVMFLFDDDKAGRAAFKKFSKSLPDSEPKRYNENTIVWALQHTDDFEVFTKRHKISREQVFFTAEFLYPVEDAARICLDLISKRSDDEIKCWRNHISGNYWPTLGQDLCHKLTIAKEGSNDWFFARGVPSSLKAKFLKEVEKRRISTKNIDYIAEKICENMLER